MGPSFCTAPYLKQRTDLVPLQVSLDPGLLTRRHGQARPGASAGDRAPWPPTEAGRAPQSLGSPGATASVPAAGVGATPGVASSWGAESCKPGRGAANSVKYGRRGELIHRLLLRAPTSRLRSAGSLRRKLEAESGLSSGRQQQESGGGKRATAARLRLEQRWGAQGEREGAPLEEPPLQVTGAHSPGFSEASLALPTAP